MPFSYAVLSIALIGALSPPLTAQEPKPRPPGVTRLPRPMTITARQVGAGKIQLSWSSVPDAVKYQVTRSVPPAPQTVLPPTADTVYLDQDVQPGSTYYYVVQAIDSSGTRGLNGGTAPVTAVAGDSAVAPVALREIKPVTKLGATAFPTP
jgi:fibronectin type 3 domain-containing protein